uniref:hypothetical protein n=1 Tax=Pararhizobium sp. IMCC3301 TaxID=3067904 RepID=UPI0027405D64|nr:hypothetical protein [Pararhizobium sp. IMCC3301]
MADFYKVLRKTIEALPVATGQARRSVYDRARTAISRQLDAMDPALPPSEVSRQRLELEDSIRVVEEDYVSGKIITNSERENTARLAHQEEEEASFRAHRSSRQVQDEAENMRRSASTPVAADLPNPSEVAPQPRLRSEPVAAPVAGAEPAAASVAAFDAAVASARSLGDAPSRATSALREPVRPKAESAMRETARAQSAEPAPERGQRPGLSRRSSRDEYYDAPALDDPYMDDVADVADDQDDYFDEEQMQRERAQPRNNRSGRSGRNGRRGEESGRGGGGRERAYSDDYYDDDQDRVVVRRRRRVWPWLLLIFLIGLGAAGWWAYQNQDTVMANFESWLDYGNDDVNPLKPAIGESSSGDGPRRVNANDAANGAAPTVAAPAESVKNDGRIIDDSGQMNPNIERGDVSAAVGEGVLPQRAILYEEGATADESQAVGGGTTWSLREEGGSPVIVGRVEVPQRRLTLDIIIRKNDDPSMSSASHLVEISYQAPPRQVGGGIDDIPALLLKSSEEAQGELLASAGVKVSDTLFWLALSATPENIAKNLDLLRKGSWFDLPVRYKNNKRAIITLEKGREGDVVFSQALDAWEQGN